MHSRIDHVIIVTPDLEASRQEFESLGFTVTPRARHPKFGTANHLCVLQHDYFELLGKDPDADPGVQLYGPVAAAVAAGGGLPFVALASDDAHGFAAALRQAGIGTEDPLTWSRDADTPDGRITATFTTFFFDPQAFPGLSFFCCQQHTRQAVWCEPWMKHANGASAIQGLRHEWASEPADAAERYRALVGPQGVSSADGELRVALDGASLVFRETPGAARTVLRLSRLPGTGSAVAGTVTPLATVANAAIEWCDE